MVDPVDDISGLIDHFTTAALADPLSAVLITIGGVLILSTVVVMTWLTVGALADAIRSVAS